mmetsp:Transcript_20420/g.33822  ORF Transcript_20420/g.33822 Transcript_20420/m.33822 type:complete len:488 (-) Transcript_20420:111-1574(-)
MKLLLLLLIILTSSAVVAAVRRVECRDATELWKALRAALPGDDLVLHPGTYVGHFSATKDATASQPITIRSKDKNNKAVMRGWSLFFDPVMYVTGDYWEVKDLVIENANKGVVYDNAIGGKILNCEIHGTGEEAIHIRDGSSQFLIEGNVVQNTGRTEAGYGEGIYIGSDRGVHYYYDPTVSFVTIRNNVIGPNVRAEGIDVREGTHDILIEDNTFDAAGLSGANSADSFIDLKGSRCIVRGNTFNQNGATSMSKGVNAIDRGVDKSSYDHVIIDNTFNFDDGSSPMVRANKNTQSIYVTDNVRNPKGTNYGGSIIQNRMPDWYTARIESTAATLAPTPAPTPRPTQPPIDMTKSYTIYANWAVTTDFWADNSSNGDFDVSYNDGGSHRSTYSATLQPGGKVQFDAAGADLTGLSELRFFIRSFADDVSLRLKVNGVAGKITAHKDWRDHVFNFSWWVPGAKVTSISFENRNNFPVSVLFDDIRFTP